MQNSIQTSFTDWESRFHLAHHGIKGQKWGVRRYQNEDGTLTALGRLRGGKEARAENKILRKTLSDDRKLSKEWRKERDRSVKRAIKDDNYRKAVADLEAHRLGMDPEETKEFFDARLAGERAADNMMWYKYGDRGYKNTVNKYASGEKIAKSILKTLQKRGVSVSANGKHFQSRLEGELGKSQSRKNAFKGMPAKSTLEMMQWQREAEKKQKQKERRELLNRKLRGG